jgi:hypothetical protein
MFGLSAELLSVVGAAEATHIAGPPRRENRIGLDTP